MNPHHESIAKLYEGALRALDTKAQIMIAFLAITMAPVFTRFEVMGIPYAIRALDGVCVAGAVLAFVYCLMPRRGRRTEGGLFNTSVTGEQLARQLDTPGMAFDPVQSVIALHDIYRLKARSVSIGIWLAAIYILSVAGSFALA
jgi:hypothetical protein